MHSQTPASRPMADGDAAQANGTAFDLQDERSAAMASKYVWWQQPRQTLADPCLLAAQIMTLGTLDDVQWLLARTSADTLRRVLRDAPAGIFNERSWRFWHLQLGAAPIPPLPVRPLPA